MKRILFFFAATLLFSGTAFSQGTNCASATPFCGNVTFPNNTSTTAQSGPSYGCLDTRPNPAWFIIKTSAAGTLNFNISQQNTSGSGIDVDFIAWGPYSSTANICNSLTGSCSGDHSCSGNIEDCSYDPAAVENMTLVSPSAGQYFMILITNYSGVAGNITFNQTGGAPTDCSITCPSVTSGNGYLLANGSPVPSSVTCSTPAFGMIASGNTPFGNPITPGIMISFTSNANNTLQINWYESPPPTFVLCAGAGGGCGLTIPTNTNEDIQFSTMSPSLTNQIEFCETSTADGNMPYTITDVSSGTVINTGTWVTDGACTTVSIPPNTISGVSTWTISPACPGCLTTTDWGSATFNPGVAPAGTYNVCYNFDPPGSCATYTYCQNITVTNPNSAAWTTPATLCSTSAAINLNSLVTGTAGGTWSGTGVSGTTFNPATSGAGVFNVTYTVGSGSCSASQVHQVTVTATPTVSISPATATICAGTSTTLTATPSTGGGTYLWAPNGQTTASITVSPGTSTTYTVTYTLAGCSSTASRLVTVNPVPTVSINTPAAICNGSSTTLTATPSTGGGTYLWAPDGQTTASISVSPTTSTTYTVTYTLAGCSGTATRLVTVNPVPTVSINTPAAICSGASTTLTATPSAGGGTYLWAPNGQTTASITVSPGTSTTYTVTYTLAGCSGTASRLVTVNPTPTVTVNTPAAICAGTSTTLTATPSAGGGTYLWAPNGQTTASISVTPGTTQTYTVTYTLAGCSNTGTSTVTVNPLPTVSISPATSSICAGSSATLTATPSAGGGTYSWASGGQTTAAITVSPGTSTTYTVTYTLAGCSATASRLVTVNPVPTVTVNTAAPICAGSSATLTATPSTGGGTYSWLPGGGTTQSISVSPGTSTTYTVTYTLAGCSNSATSLVTVNPLPTVTISPATSTICAGASATLTASPSLGGGTYSWASGGQTTAAITVSPAGTTTYTVTYTLSGCTGTATRQVTVNPLDNAAFGYGSSTYCQTGTDPAATGVATAGTFAATPAGLVFLNTTTGLIDLSASALGSYTVTHTTTGTCPNTSSVTITITSAPSATFSYAGPFCKNAANPFPTFPGGSSAGTFTSTPAGLVFVNSNTGQINLATSTPGTYSITNTIAAGGGCASAVFGPVTVTINPSPVITASPTSQTICSGTATNIALSSSISGTTYSWTVSQTGVSGGSPGTTPPIAQTLNTTTTAAGTATYTVTSTSGGCAGNTLTIPVTVNPVPTGTASPSAQTICSGNTTSISLAGSLSGTTFSWAAPTQTGGASGGTAGSGSSIVQGLTATGTSAGTVTYNVIPSANSCPGSPIPVIITVNPTPVVTATPLTSTICSGASTGITLSSPTSGTTFTWTATNGAGISGATSASGTSISQILNNSSTVLSTATYSITPTAATCAGTPVLVTVNVNPTPTVTATPSAQTICSGGVTSIALSGTVGGTVFNWVAPVQTGASGGTASSGTSIAQTLLATGTSPGTVTYTIIPTANSCPGSPIPVIITVNPVPFATATPATATICSGATTAIALSSFTSGTTFSWTATSTAGISGSGPGSGPAINQTLSNSGTTGGSVTYVITPIAGGCPGTPINVTVNVNPVPNVSATPPAQSICSGTATGIALTSTVSGTTFTWGAPTQSGATGGNAGSGTSIGDVLTATGTSAGTVTYNIVPSANSCPGSSVPVIITVNPNPAATASPAATVLCSGGTTSIPLSSNIPGTTFGWTVTSSGTTGESAGTGSSIGQTLSTTGNIPGTVTYTITASTPSGCTSVLSPVIITVNPIPDVAATPSNQTICSGTATSIALAGAVAGSSFSWTVAQSGVTGASAASGSSIAQGLTATGTTPGTATYTITPSANGCPGTPITVAITVNPNPVVTATPATQSICDGSATSISLGSNLGATTFGWTVAQTGVTGATAGAGSSISQLLNLASPTTAGSVIYTITPTDNGCPGTPITVTVNVNAIDNAAFNYSSSTYCQTGIDPSATITGTPGGVFHYIPAGLVIDSVSGLIDLSASTLGSYGIGYQTNGVCPNSSSVVITITTAPNATFSYAASVCSSDPNPVPAFGPGASAGNFTASPSGLVFADSTTGEVNLILSAAGTYTVTNTIPPAGGCATATSTGTITISQAATVDAGINDTICQLQTFTLTGTMGGSTSSVIWSTNGSGVFNDTTSLTGVYTPSAADIAAGSVVLTVTTNDPSGACTAVNDFVVLDITPLDVATFSYTGATFCQSGTDPVPTVTGVSGGAFSANPAGIVFVSNLTGEIDLSASTIGTYSIVYSTNGPCPSADTVSLTITNAPTATFSFTAGAAAFCQTGTDPAPVFGAGASAGVFTASPSGLTFVNPATGQIDLSASTPGVYVLTNSIAAAGGCASAVDSMTITINQPALVNAGNDTAVCAGTNIITGSSSIGGSATASTWTSGGSGIFGDAAILNTTYTPSAADITAGSVTLYLTTNDPVGACGAVTDSILVTITPLPTAPPVIAPPEYCAGSTVGALTATSAGGTISWYSDSGLSTFLSNANPFTPTGVTGTTSFWVTETIGACVSPAVQVTITFNPLPVADTSATTVTSADCGTSTGAITGVTIVSGESPYTYVWQDAGGSTVDTTLNLTGVGPGVYTLTITDANGCVTQVGGSSSFSVTSTSAVIAAFTPDPVSGEKPLTVNFTNNSTGAVNYLWSFGTGTTSMLTDPSYIYTQLGNFTVCLYADNGLGCADTACSSIDVFINSTFVIPNVFTPNDDGVNDIFTVKNVGLETLDAEIYNRWGQKEYEWHTTNGGWDGRTASGVFAPDGTYYFIISAKGFDGKEYLEKGGFTLIR